MLPVIGVPDDVLKELGTLVIRFNHLELILEMTLIRVFRLKHDSLRSHVPFANMSFLQRVEILETLLSVISMENAGLEPLATFKAEILPKLTSVNKRRNALLHSRWSHRDGKVETMQLHAKGTLKYSRMVVTAKEIQKLNEAISDTANSVFGLVTGEYAYQSYSAKGTVSEAPKAAANAKTGGA